MEFSQKKTKDSLSFRARRERKKGGTIKLSAFITLHGFIEDIKENTFQHKPINYYVCSIEWQARVKVDEKSLNCEVCEKELKRAEERRRRHKKNQQKKERVKIDIFCFVFHFKHYSQAQCSVVLNRKTKSIFKYYHFKKFL